MSRERKPACPPDKPKFGTCPHCGRSVMVDWDDRTPKTYWPHDTDAVSRIPCPMIYKPVEGSKVDETPEQWMERLLQTKRDLEKAGHHFGGTPMRCLRCGRYIGVLVNLPIHECLENLPSRR